MRNKLFFLFIVYLLSLNLTLNMQVIPPLIPHIIKNWHIDRAQAGLIMGVISLPPLFLGIFGGYILDNYGTKIPIIISLFLYFIGELSFVLAKDFIFLIISRLIVGFGAIVLAVVGFKILAEKFQGRNLGKAIGFNSTAMPISTLLSFNIFGLIAEKLSWKTPMLILAVFTLMLIIIIALLYKEEKIEKRDENSNFLSNIKSISSKVWILSILWLLFNAGSLSFLTFAPDYFISKGFPYSLSSSISSLYMIGALFSPLIGYFLDKTSKPYTFIFFSAISLSISLFLIYFSKYAVLLLIIAGFCSALLPPTVFYLLPKFTDKLGLGYAILSSLLNLGTLLAPYFVGYAKDISGSYFPSFLLMSLFIFSSGILSLFFKTS